jgi:putative ATP-dependent endonuclease of OLD family
MYLSQLRLWNFRKYGVGARAEGSGEPLPGMTIQFHEGVNVLIGENDSGKTAIIDAIRYALKTQSGEYIQYSEQDFHQNTDGSRTSDFKIECTFRKLTQQDAGLFYEWLDYDKDKDEYFLKIVLQARLKDNMIHPMFTAGPSDSVMDTKAHNQLRTVYLKPLRDALTDMTHGYKSRLAQILSAHPLFLEENDEQGNVKRHTLVDSYERLKQEVDNYFKGEENGADITKDINEFLQGHFLIDGDPRKASIHLTGSDLIEILRQLDLVLEGNKSGLGSLNLLCIAAELLMMKKQASGLRLALVEELEAHLHPQYQLRLINYIVKNQDNEQFILTTHSITLASKIHLENLIVLKGDKAYPMSSEYTDMPPTDYHFLERFLDATKANLFFARGLILVEGDAENLLLPVIAELVGTPLQQYGVSIVNVGSTAYKRYLSIFSRKDNQDFDMPIAVVTDMDVRCLEYYKDHKSRKESTAEELNAKRKARKEKLQQLESDKIKICLPLEWTFEYEIARSPLYTYLALAVMLAKKAQDTPAHQLDEQFILNCFDKVKAEYPMDQPPTEKAAYEIFKPLNGGVVSKAITAQYMADILSGGIDCLQVDTEEIKKQLTTDSHLKYLYDAIKFVTTRTDKS